MITKEYIERLADEMGLSAKYIVKKAKETLAVMEKKGIVIKRNSNILVAYDMNGPLTAVHDATLNPLPTTQKGILSIQGENVVEALMSGWDLKSLKSFREKIGASEMGIIGELGAIFTLRGNKTYEPCPVESKIHYKMKKDLYLAVAEAGLKIAVQGNASTRVACFYFEAESESRGNLKNHPLSQNISIRTIFDVLEEIEGGAFEYDDNENIRFEPSDRNIMIMDYVLSQVFPLTSVRFKKRGRKIIFWRDPEDDTEFTINEMVKFSEDVIPKGWEIDPNPDYCIDLVYIEDGIKLNKEFTANEFAKRIFGEEDFIITNVGDKKSDLLEGDNTLFFPVTGTQAEEYCEENEIPCVSVLHGGDYGLVIAYLLAMNQSENKNERYREDFDYFTKKKKQTEEMEGIFPSLKNEVIVVVGTGGIGGAIVNDFLKQDAKVFALDKSQDVLDGLGEKKGLTKILVDVTKHEEFETVLQKIGEENVSIRSFVYTAGIGTSSPVSSFSDGFPEKLYNLNVLGFVYGLKYIHPFLKKGSSVTVISSINAYRSESEMAIYDSTKAALLQYVRTASVELGPQGIRVNAIAPGYVETPQTEKELENPESVAVIVNATSLRRIGKPEDISSVVVALASRDLGFATGACFEISGGLGQAMYKPIEKQENI